MFIIGLLKGCTVVTVRVLVFRPKPDLIKDNNLITQQSFNLHFVFKVSNYLPMQETWSTANIYPWWHSQW